MYVNADRIRHAGQLGFLLSICMANGFRCCFYLARFMVVHISRCRYRRISIKPLFIHSNIHPHF